MSIKELLEIRIKMQGTILFPEKIQVTPCKWRTNSYLIKTPHGVVRKTIRSLV